MTETRKEKLLDALGWKLLTELQKNARLSFAELGRRVGLSTPAVSQRIARMEDEGIIRGCRADIDPECGIDDHGICSYESGWRCPAQIDCSHSVYAGNR